MPTPHEPATLARKIWDEAHRKANGNRERFIHEARLLASYHDLTQTAGELEDGSPCYHIVFSADDSILKIPVR